MLRSMYSGISGLRNFQTKLDVIGNNIANVNTYGFKKGRTIFKDLISQTVAGASAPTATRGGVNPKQVGLGSQISAIDTIHSGGSTQFTGNTLDLAISGDGFFQVADGIGGTATTGPTGFTNTLYTRAGNFYMDQDGYLVNSDGKYLVGNAANVTSQLVTQTTWRTEPANASDVAALPTGHDTSTYLIDINGNRMNTSGGSPATQAQGVRIFNGSIYNGSTGTPIEVTTGTAPIVPHELKIDSNTGTLYIEDAAGTKFPLFENSAGNLVYLNSSNSEVAINSATNNAGGVTSSVLFNTVASSVRNDGTIRVDTYDSTFTSFKPIIIPTTAQSMSVGQDGTVSFVDQHGNLQWAGQLQLAKFPNPGGLEKVGGNYFQQTSNSGLPVTGIATTNGIGEVVSGFLEMSNVDLAEEFTEMIVAQRGFQANTRIITTSDEILQELVNLKR